jgi:hypothetical protein
VIVQGFMSHLCYLCLLCKWWPTHIDCSSIMRVLRPTHLISIECIWRVSYKGKELLRENLNSPPVLLEGFVVLIFLVFCCPLKCCDVHFDLGITWCLVRLYLQLFVEGLMSYLCYLRIAVSNVYCVGFFCIRLVYSIFLVTLDCPFLISPSVFSNVYFKINPNIFFIN